MGRKKELAEEEVYLIREHPKGVHIAFRRHRQRPVRRALSPWVHARTQRRIKHLRRKPPRVCNAVEAPVGWLRDCCDPDVGQERGVCGAKEDGGLRGSLI